MKRKLFAWMLAISFAFTNVNSFAFAEEVQEEETEETSEEISNEETVSEKKGTEEIAEMTKENESTGEYENEFQVEEAIEMKSDNASDESFNNDSTIPADFVAEDEGYIEETYDSTATDPSSFKYKVIDGEVKITKYNGNSSNVVIPSVIDGYPVTSMDGYVFSSTFYENSKLTSVTIPASITHFSGSAFSNCLGLKTAGPIGSGSNIEYGWTESIPDQAFECCGSLINVTIPYGIKSIGVLAFHGTSIRNISIPESVTNIGKRAFENCRELTDITIPDSVTSIGTATFWDCTSLVNIEISNVSDIGENAFENCTSLSSIEIPDNVTNIENNAFYKCTGLTSVVFKGSAPKLGKYCFEGCKNIKAFYINNGTWTEENMLNYGAESIEWIIGDGSEFENPIVIIPGVMGSNLYDSEGNKIWAASGDLFNQIYEVRKCKDLDLSVNSYLNVAYNLYNQTEQEEYEPDDREPVADDIYREYGAGAMYKNIVDGLCEAFPDRRIYFFSYDWRKSNEDSAKELKKLIDEITKTGTGQVDIVAHSMGGLVTSCYIKDFDFENKVNKIITCGTPYEGSPTLLHRALTNVTLGKYIPDTAILLSGMKQEIKQCFPSLAELAPTDNYQQIHPTKHVEKVVSEKKGARKQREKFVAGYEYIITDMILDEYHSNCSQIFKQNYENARRLHDSLKESSGGKYNLLLDRKNTYFIVGINQMTIESVAIDRDGNVVKLYCETGIEGDGTVPYDSATMNGALGFDLGVDKYGNTRFFQIATDHGGTANCPKAVNYIVDVLGTNETNEPFDEVSYRKEESLYIRIECPGNVYIEKNGEILSSAMENLHTTSSFGRLDISGENGEIKHLWLDEDLYDISLFGTKEGIMDMSLEWLDEDNNTVIEKQFPQVPITEQTEISIESNRIGESVLNIDNDSDGNVDENWYVEIKYPVSIDVSLASAEIPTNESLELKINASPEDANDNVTWTSSNTKIATVDRNGIVTAKMYGKAVITAISNINPSLSSTCTVQTRFYDVNDSTQSYYKPVYWGADNGVVAGYDGGVYFGPDNVCTRAQFVTFLWRLAGKPTGNKNVSFKDVSTSVNYYRAVKWAVSEGIIVGYKDDNTFRPDNEVTRGQVATMLWRFAGRKTPTLPSTSPFSDINASNSSYRAVVWGQKAGVIKGYKDGTFQPDASCLRQHIVTFLYRYARDVMGKKVN